MPLIRNLKDDITITPQGPLSLPHLLRMRTYVMYLHTQVLFVPSQGETEPADSCLHHGSGEWNSNNNTTCFLFSHYCQGTQGPTPINRSCQVPNNTNTFSPNSPISCRIMLVLTNYPFPGVLSLEEILSDVLSYKPVSLYSHQ